MDTLSSPTTFQTYGITVLPRNTSGGGQGIGGRRKVYNAAVLRKSQEKVVRIMATVL